VIRSSLTFALTFALAFAFAMPFAFAEKYEGAMSFDHPAGWKTEAVSDISADNAVRLDAPVEAGKTPPVRWALVLVGSKKAGDGDLESEAAAWHTAHVRNRSAWGMKSEGGTPRDLFRLNGKRALRYRDHVGSALGSNEQTVTCSVIAARLACVIVAGSPSTRDAVDALSVQILGSLQPRKR
jgi:hypothetical protein